jgi:hypothetical protein
MARLNDRHRPRIPPNIVYRSIRAAGGPTALRKALGVSEATLKRWRRAGVVSDGRAVLAWVALIHSTPVEQLRLARRLVGLPAGRRVVSTTPHPSTPPST